MEAAKTAEKASQKLEAELTAYQGRELYAATPPDARGRRVHQAAPRTGPIDYWRLLAQQFTSAGPDALFLLTLGEPPTLLLALSEGGGNAGQIVKAAIEPLGGRGGGNARLAQASLPDAARAAEAARRVLEML